MAGFCTYISLSLWPHQFPTSFVWKCCVWTVYYPFKRTMQMIFHMRVTVWFSLTPAKFKRKKIMSAKLHKFVHNSNPDYTKSSQASKTCIWTLDSREALESTAHTRCMLWQTSTNIQHAIKPSACLMLVAEGGRDVCPASGINLITSTTCCPSQQSEPDTIQTNRALKRLLQIVHFAKVNLIASLTYY